jgi:hypothetical protein
MSMAGFFPIGATSPVSCLLMGLYGEPVVPRVVDLACGLARFDSWRRQATDGLAGRVVEIGFGSGRNVPHYPTGVEVVFAVEPAGVARRMARRRIDMSPVPIVFVGLARGRRLTRDPTTLVEEAGGSPWSETSSVTPGAASTRAGSRSGPPPTRSPDTGPDGGIRRHYVVSDSSPAGATSMWPS